MAVRAMVEGGESFARLRVVPHASSVPLHIDLLDRDQVPLDLHRDIGGGARIRAGIELNCAGQSTQKAASCTEQLHSRTDRTRAPPPRSRRTSRGAWSRSRRAWCS